jgi:hypothetical protein
VTPMTEALVLGAATCFVLGYLLYALLAPEEF